MISQSVVYTFKIDLNGEKTELSLTEDTKGKSYLFPEEDLLNSMKSVEFDNNVSPLVSQETFIRELPPVEIAGPIELRIEGSRQLRLAMPVSFFLFTLVKPLLYSQLIFYFSMTWRQEKYGN